MEEAALQTKQNNCNCKGIEIWSQTGADRIPESLDIILEALVLRIRHILLVGEQPQKDKALAHREHIVHGPVEHQCRRACVQKQQEYSRHDVQFHYVLGPASPHIDAGRHYVYHRHGYRQQVNTPQKPVRHCEVSDEQPAHSPVWLVVAQKMVGRKEEWYLYQKPEGGAEGAGRCIALKTMGRLDHAVSLLPGVVLLYVGQAPLHPLLHLLLLPLPHLGDVEQWEHDYGHAQGEEYDGDAIAPGQTHIASEQESQHCLYRLYYEKIQ